MNRDLSKLMLFCAVTSMACGPEAVTMGERVDDEAAAEEAFSSSRATQLDFVATLSLETSGSVWNPRSLIDSQLLYTIGQLNGSNGVGRLDKVSITDVKTEALSTGGSKVTYTVKLPVAWGSKSNLPTSYELVLPKVADYSGLDAFAAKYQTKCVDFGAHEVSSGNLWYYYRPARSSCALDAADVVRATATVSVSTENTSGRYPEYTKVWEDGVFNVVAVFGKYEDGATTSSDAGIAAYNAFIRAVRSQLSALNLVTVPAVLPSSPGVQTPDVTLTGTLPNGRTVVITALLVDNVRSGGAAFDARYEALSTRADLIAYNGHAGLGSNVRALARKGHWVSGQYAIFLMNGCDTFAYVDGSMAQTRAALNPDDPSGTKYMEIVTNAMPAYFSEMPDTTMALVNGLLSVDAPKTYQQMFDEVASNQVIVVTGEEDNAFHPGADPVEWAGLDVTATLSQGQTARYATDTLKPGTYVFQMTGTGDAGLFIRAGLEPTTRSYDCRGNVKGSSNETCSLTLTAAAPIHVLIRGYAGPTASVRLVGSVKR